MNVKNKEDKDKYKSEFFTEQGYKTLENFLKNLIREYIVRVDYPYKIPAILGVPLFTYALEVKSEDELLGRIKILAQVLGIAKMEFKHEGKTFLFDMSGKFEYF